MNLTDKYRLLEEKNKEAELSGGIEQKHKLICHLLFHNLKLHRRLISYWLPFRNRNFGESLIYLFQ